MAKKLMVKDSTFMPMSRLCQDSLFNAIRPDSAQQACQISIIFI
jgi:hypothetical protein